MKESPMSRSKTISVKNAEYQIIEALKTNRSKRTKLQQAFIEGIEGVKQAIAAGFHFTRIIHPAGRALSDWAKNFIGSGSIDEVIELDPELYAGLCDRSKPSELLATCALPGGKSPRTLFPRIRFFSSSTGPATRGISDPS
jgi:hypothetical protein